MAYAGTHALVPRVPTEAMWGGLARDLMLWRDGFVRPSLNQLLKMMDIRDLPDWLLEEPALQDPDNVPSKGTFLVLIWKAMIHDYEKELQREAQTK